MWLINNETFELEDFLTETTPPYAILSHTWGARETTFDKLMRSADVAKIDPKIHNTCRIAKEYGLKYAWIDTCCIDKRSSAELSEAINSMYRWYRDATVCFVYLEDVSHSTSIAIGIRDCRWRTRGWTLQELIAPKNVQFFDAEWQLRGNKQKLLKPLARYTRIPGELLAGHQSLEFYEGASKMAWASERRTSRTEDLAYCLMGIFDVNLPLLYGEGQKAFQRLQEEILRQTPDISLLLWQGWTDDGLDLQKAAPVRSSTQQQSIFLPVLAQSPEDFVLAESNLAITIDEAVEVSLDRQSLTTYNDGTKVSVLESGHATASRPMRYWFDVRSVMGGRQAKRWLPLRKIAPGIFAVESRDKFMDKGSGIVSTAFIPKLSVVLRPSLRTMSRASEVRKWGIRIPPNPLPGFYISQIRPHTRWDPTDQVFFQETQGSANRVVYSIELQSIGPQQDKQKLMVLLEPQWTRSPFRGIRIAKVSSSDDYTPIVECGPALYREVWGSFLDSGVSWDLFLTRWPEVLDWRDTSSIATGDRVRQCQEVMAELRPSEMSAFGSVIKVLDLILKVD